MMQYIAEQLFLRAGFFLDNYGARSLRIISDREAKGRIR